MRAVFLDRDDTLVEDPGYMSSPDQVRLAAYVPQALRRLQRAGYLLVVVSNQSGVARGLVTPSQVKAIERRIVQLLPEVTFSGFEYCFHHPDHRCACRKPQPAMIQRAAARLGVDLSRSVMVGDQESDVIAGRGAGCQTVRLVAEPVGHQRQLSTTADHVARHLLDATDWILGLPKSSPPPTAR